MYIALYVKRNCLELQRVVNTNLYLYGAKVVKKKQNVINKRRALEPLCKNNGSFVFLIRMGDMFWMV